MPLGNYRHPVPGTIEVWLKEQEGQWGIGLASQMAQILIKEGYAERTAKTRIRFVSYQSTPDQVPQNNTQPSNPVPDAPVPVSRLPLSGQAVETRDVSPQQPLRSYFEIADQQLRALNAAAARGWLDPRGNLELYDASWRAFDSSTSAFNALQNFEKIYNELKRPGRDGWNVFRPCGAADCWPAQQIFDTIKREFPDLSWRGPTTLLNFRNSGTGPRLESNIEKMRRIKPNQGYPTMAVSKFLHFSNPSLFPIYDYEVVWKKVLKGRFENGVRESCRSTNVPYENLIKNDTAAFLRYYMEWAGSLLSFSHDSFMQVFVEWLGRQPGVDLRQSTFDPATLYATAFEFTAIGATAVP